jgi:hypothetical protein
MECTLDPSKATTTSGGPGVTTAGCPIWIAGLRVRFSDGHVGVLLPRGLGAIDGPPADDRTEDAKRTWTAAELGAPPSADWPAYLGDPEVRIAALSPVCWPP